MGFLAESFTSEESSKGGNHSYALNPGTRELDEKGHGRKCLGNCSSKLLIWHTEKAGIGEEVDRASQEMRCILITFALPYQ